MTNSFKQMTRDGTIKRTDISTEFMADAPEGDFDRSFADGVLEDIAAQLRKGVLS